MKKYSAACRGVAEADRSGIGRIWESFEKAIASVSLELHGIAVATESDSGPGERDVFILDMP